MRRDRQTTARNRAPWAAIRSRAGRGSWLALMLITGMLAGQAIELGHSVLSDHAAGGDCAVCRIAADPEGVPEVVSPNAPVPALETVAARVQSVGPLPGFAEGHPSRAPPVLS